MPETARTAHDMIAGMTPTLAADPVVFVTTRDPALAATLSPEAISLFREEEGLSLIIPVALAQRAGLSPDQPMVCITLNVYSALEGVGLTAAVAGALGQAAIPCNMVAAFHHDHVFVPEAMGARAMEVLTGLQKRAAQGG